MAINKNFVVKNGIEVNTNLIVADTDSNKVGIGTTVPEYTLHVFEGAGIGVTDITITGISTNLDELNVGVGGTTLTAISNATLGIGGSVGVGTDAPGYLLEVHSPVSSGQTALFVRGDMRVTGDINIDDISIGDLNVSGISTFVGNILIGTGATVGFGSTAYFKDYAKAIFGDGEDLKVYHDGSNSYISDTGTGGLIVGSNSLTVKNAALNETQAVFTENGSVELYHDNSKRFETNAIGVEVSGTFESTGITTLASSGGITTTGGDLYVGGDLFINEDIVLDTNLEILGIATIGSLHVTGISTLGGTVNGPNNNNSVVVGTGLSVHGSATGVAVTLAGAGGITTTGGDFYVGGDLYISEDVVLDTNLNILGIATIGVLQVSSTSGINTISSTVQSSSKDTGALVIEGGVGIEKNLFVGGGAEVTGLTTITGVLDANNTTQSSSSTTGAAKFAGGVGVAKNLYVGGGAEVTGLTTITGVLDANNTTQSTSATTGSAQFAGGVGIEKQLYVGAGASVGAGFTIGTGIGVTTILDDDTFTNASAGALASQQSIKAYVDAQVTAADLDFGGDSGTGAVDLDSQTFTISGTANEIETSASNQTLTIGLPNFVTVSNGLNVTGNGSTTTTLNVTGLSTFSGAISVGDTVSLGDHDRLRFGDGNDLQIYHNGTNNYIDANGDFYLRVNNGTETSLYATSDGAVQLNYDNVKKFETGPAGTITVGVGTFDGLSLGDNEKAFLGASDDLQIYHNTNSYIENYTGNLFIFNASNDKDIHLQSDNGSGGLADYVLCDGSTGAVALSHYGTKKFETTGAGVTVTGVGTFSQSISIASSVYHLGDDNTHFGFPAADTFTVYTAGSERLRVTSGGEVLVNTTAAGSNAKFEVRSTTGSITSATARLNGDATDTGAINTGSSLLFAGHDGGNASRDFASIFAGKENGTSGNYDAYLAFGTRSNGNTLAERLRIRSDGGIVATGIATFSTTAHLTVPVGTTAQRDSNVANGMIRYNTTLNSYEGYGNGAWGGLGGGTEIDISVSSTSATNLTTFAHASYRSASFRVQITQGTSYQVGKYLLIHDGTTVTMVEESAIATGSMLGDITSVINGSNVEIKVTMYSASSATVTTIIDKITV